MKTNHPSDSLFRLIHSCSDAEARYFPQYLNRTRVKEAKGYARIFKLIKKQKQYDENKIKEKLNYPTLLKDFVHHKNILSGLIEESLVAFRRAMLATSQLHLLLDTINLMYEKQLYERVTKLIDKAWKLALKYEKHFILLEINNVQRLVLKNSAETDFLLNLKKINSEKENIQNIIDNESCLASINDSIYSLYREHHHIQTPEQKAELEKLMQDTLLGDENNAFAFFAKLKFNGIHSFYHQLTANFEEAFRYRKRIIELWDAHPYMKTEYVTLYRADLTNLINLSVLVKTTFDLEDYISRIKSIGAGTSADNAAVFSSEYFSRHFYLLNTGQYDQALKLVPAIEEGLKRFGNSINATAKLTLCYNIGSTYFLNDMYPEALRAYERVSNTSRKHDVRTDLRDVCGIFRIILLYLTGKHDLAGYEILNTRQRLKNNNKLYELEQVVLQYIPLLIAAKKGSPEETKTFNDFHEKTEQLFALPRNKCLIGLEDIVLWGRRRQ